MSYEKIRKALEMRLLELLPVLPTSWENHSFTVPGTIYQRAFLLPANSSNPTHGDSMVRESGIFQVSVCGPLGSGSAETLERAELIREWFKRGVSMEEEGVLVRILKSPSLAPAIHEPTAYVIPVSTTYQADIF